MSLEYKSRIDPLTKDVIVEGIFPEYPGAIGTRQAPNGITTPIYPPRWTKRGRSTADQVESRRNALLRIVRSQAPMTVRQAYYRATVAHLVDKTEQGYGIIKDDLKILREDGTMPFSWIVDNTRMMRKPVSYTGIEAALDRTASLYRRDMWANSDAYVEIWLEKDALSGVVYPITSRYDVPLMTARGYSSISFVYSTAQTISAAMEAGKEIYIYHFGDYDPSGQDAARDIEEKIRRYVAEDETLDADEINFERVSVTPDQIRNWDLPTRPNKKSDTRTAKFEGAASVELDAIEPNQLRKLVEDTILSHVDQDELRVNKVAEESEREFLRSLAAAQRDLSA
jgi:hypothetical protein